MNWVENCDITDNLVFLVKDNLHFVRNGNVSFLDGMVLVVMK